MNGGRETLWQRIWWIARGPVRALLRLAHAVGLIRDPLAHMHWTKHHLVDEETMHLWGERRARLFEAAVDDAGFQVCVGFDAHSSKDAQRIVWRSETGDDWVHTETRVGKPRTVRASVPEPVEKVRGQQHQVTMASGVRIRAIAHRTGFKGSVEWSTIDRQVPGRDWKTRVYSFRGLWTRYIMSKFIVTDQGVIALGYSDRLGRASQVPHPPRVWTSVNGKWWFLNRKVTRLMSDGRFWTWMPGAAVRDGDVIVVTAERPRPEDPDFGGPESVPTVWHGTLRSRTSEGGEAADERARGF